MNTVKQLETIQKTFRVFRILTKIAMIFSIVGAALCAVGAACYVSGASVFRIWGTPFVASEFGAAQTLATLLTDMLMLTTEAILLGGAYRYLTVEQADGTPFTVKGADMLKKLGIRCIVLPIVTIVICCVIAVCLGVEEVGDRSNLPSLVTGIVLILASLIFRYGAVLEENAKC